MASLRGNPKHPQAVSILGHFDVASKKNKRFHAPAEMCESMIFRVGYVLRRPSANRTCQGAARVNPGDPFVRGTRLCFLGCSLYRSVLASRTASAEEVWNSSHLRTGFL